MSGQAEFLSLPVAASDRIWHLSKSYTSDLCVAAWVTVAAASNDRDRHEPVYTCSSRF